MIIAALKEVIFSRHPARNLIESMMKWDFKIGERKANLMRLCFSSFAAWPLFVIILLISFDPFKSSWSLVETLSYENPFVLFLLDGHLSALLVFFFVAFVTEWLFRKEYLFVALLFYFLNRGELHISLATVAVLGVYLARVCYLWWLAVDCESETQKIWNTMSLIQMAAWLLTAVAAVWTLDFVLVNHLFNAGSSLTRVGFLTGVLLFYHCVSHVLLSVWGHFYSRGKIEPSFLPVYYSTANWILRFKMSDYSQYALKKLIETQLQKHNKSQEQFDELKAQNPALSTLSVESVLKKEIAYLKEASFRLSKI